jgi:uncharacterized protein YkwD
MSFVLAVHARRSPRVAGRRLASITALAFGITALGMLVAPRQVYAWDANAFSSSSEKQLVSLTNQSRASAGLKALKVDSTLTAVARSRSKDMIVRDYFSHNIPPSGKNVFSILDSKGYCYAIAGENIGWNNYPDDTATRTVHRMFMESSGHRANIMGKKWDVVGVGAYKGPTGKKMWTVIFADKCGGSKSSGGGGGSSGGGGTTKTVTKPKRTPKPTPKPTPVPTPKRTMPPEPTDAIGLGLGLGPGGRHQDNGPGKGADRGDGGQSGNGPPPGQAANGREGTLRVVDPTSPPGLVETIVGDVTGFYLGG